MKLKNETEKLRQTYAGSDCLLNGLPARITASSDGFAYVRQTKTSLGAFWSWQAVDHIMTRTKNPGEFRTEED